MIIDRFFPFFDMSKTLDEMDRLFGSVGRPTSFRSVPRGTFPAINIYDQDDAVILTAEIPGVSKDDLELSVLGKSVTLKGQRRAENAPNVTYYRNERPTGPFERTLTLPDSVKADSAKADYRDGILHVRIEKARPEKARRITIKS